MTPDITTQPPHDLELERAVLGHAILWENDYALQALSPGDFYSISHKTIHSAMLAVREDGDPLCVESITHKLRKEFRCQGDVIDALMDCMKFAAVNMQTAQYNARKVLEYSMCRSTMNQAYETISQCRDGSGKVSDVVEENLEKFQSIASRGASAECKDEMQAMLGFVDSISPQKRRRPVYTPWTMLNNLVTGWFPGEVTIIAARPRVGKTSLALNCINDLNKNRIPSIFFSLEMSTTDLAQRLLSIRSKIPFERFRRETDYTEEEARVISEKSSELCTTKMFFHDNPDMTIDNIESIARQHKAQYGVRIVFIDYLGLINIKRERNDTRQEQVARISRNLKRMAKRLNVPVVCLAQINRQFDNRASCRPRLSDLRGSGAIEQDADVVWLLSREIEDFDGFPSDDEKQSDAIITVAKNRNGRTGDLNLDWDGSTQTFKEPRLK